MSTHSCKIVIVDYGMGNIRSVVNAFEYLQASVLVTNDPKKLIDAEAIVIPGQGAIRDCMANLEKYHLIETLREQVMEKKKPYLGICLGLQVLGDKSFEGGEYKCLGWIKGKVQKIKPKDLKIPHLGWNDVRISKPSPLFNDFNGRGCFYFAHSYILFPQDKSVVTAITDYGGELPVAVQKDNIMGVQFHPEKSQLDGLKLLKNFIKLLC